MNITILGMGKTGHTVSCYLRNQGHNVVCWDRNIEKLNCIKNGIEVTGCLEGKFFVNICSDIKAAIKEAEFIFVNTLAMGHKDIALLLKGNLNQDQNILIFNSNWGIMEFLQVFGDEVKKKNISISETGGMHIMSDLPEVGKCHIKKIKKSLAISCYPKEKGNEILNTLLPIFPQFFLKENPILTSLDTSNPVLHAPIALGQFSKLENGSDYFFYEEGGTPFIVKYVENVDRERLLVMKAIGVQGQSCLDIVNKAWNSDCNDLYAAIHKNYKASKGPKSPEYRFITEDVPYGIVPIVKLGEIFGVKTPYSSAIVNMYSLLMNRDFMSLGPVFNKNEIINLL